MPSIWPPPPAAAIVVTNTPGANSGAVADHALALSWPRCAGWPPATAGSATGRWTVERPASSAV